MNSFDGTLECEPPAGVTEPALVSNKLQQHVIPAGIPEPRGVKLAAAAAFGDRPRLFVGCAFAVFGVNVGVNEGESTLRLFFWLQYDQRISRQWVLPKDQPAEPIGLADTAEVMIVIAFALLILDTLRAVAA